MKGRKFFPKKRGAKKATKGYMKGAHKVTDKHIARVCKNVISRNTENKIASYSFPSNQNLYVYGNMSWANNNVFPISPYTTFLDIVQGTSQQARIGNSLTIKKATLKLLFNLLPYDLTNNATPGPLIIQMVTFYDKTQTTTEPTALPNFFQNGSSSTAPNTLGLPQDILRSINKDRYKVFRRHTFKLGNSNFAGTGTSAIRQQYANNDYQLTHMLSMDYTKYLVKKVKYDDSVASPTTRGLFCAILVMSGDSTNLSTGNTIAAKFTGFMQIEYEDA